MEAEELFSKTQTLHKVCIVAGDNLWKIVKNHSQILTNDAQV